MFRKSNFDFIQITPINYNKQDLAEQRQIVIHFLISMWVTTMLLL